MTLVVPKGVRAEFFILNVAKGTRIDMKIPLADAKAIDAGRQILIFPFCAF